MIGDSNLVKYYILMILIFIIQKYYLKIYSKSNYATSRLILLKYYLDIFLLLNSIPRF